MKDENISRCDLCTARLFDTLPGTMTVISIVVVTEFLDENGQGIPGAEPQDAPATVRFCTNCTALIGSGTLKTNEAVVNFVAHMRAQLNRIPS